MTDLLQYSEVQYAAYCACRDRPMAELRAYFGSVAAEQMERRYQAEHCFMCDAVLTEAEASRSDRSGVSLCDHHRKMRDTTPIGAKGIIALASFALDNPDLPKLTGPWLREFYRGINQSIAEKQEREEQAWLAEGEKYRQERQQNQ